MQAARSSASSPTRSTLSVDAMAWWHGSCITAIAESPVKAGVLWAGTDDGNLQMTRDGGQDLGPNVDSHCKAFPRALVSRIEAPHGGGRHGLRHLDNHRSADFGIYIYATTNSRRLHGHQITNRHSARTAGTVHVIREDPAESQPAVRRHRVRPVRHFRPRPELERDEERPRRPVPVFDLQIHPRDHDLILATHGPLARA